MSAPRTPEGRALAAELGALLTAAREELGENRRALANTLGVSDVTLLHYERGTMNPTLDKVATLAAQYGLEVHITARPLPA